MKRKLVWNALFLLLAYPATALADTIEGVITRTGPMGIDMTVYDEKGMPFPNGLHLKTDRRTQVNGVPSSALLRKNDYVKVNVRQENDGVWRADSVTKLGVSTISQPNSFATSVSNAGTKLMDTLRSPTGQKYLRSGLTGAVVGGTSAYAAGGKGGKGALIGAGLGAVATLIQDLFNQHQQAPQQTVYVSDSPSQR